MAGCLRAVLWRNDELNMFEYCALKETGAGIRLEGIAVAAVDGKPLRAAYEITCDPQGHTRLVVVDVTGGLGEHHIRLEADEQQTWRQAGKELAHCRDSFDVDLGFSPSTNTLPIRRLRLDQGQSATVTAAWVRFPELDVVPFPQRYTRTAPDRYLFESLLTDFQAELLVDELGLVQLYGPYWQAAASGQEC